MKIILGSLRHKTVGRHSPFMPIGPAYIASYAMSKISDLDIHIHDDPDDILKDIREWSPDVIGLSNYCWNSELSSLVFKQSKEYNPNILTVSGGPDFPTHPKKCKEYLMRKKGIDFYAQLEGEPAFCNLINLFLNCRDILKLKDNPVDGFVSIHPSSDELLIGKKVPRIMDLDKIPSPYLNHLLDPWFDGNNAPSLETTRGCPFLCTYCHTGSTDYNSIGKFSIERTKAELKYIAEKMKDSPEIVLSLCDTNFGIYKKDEEVINYIKELQIEYGWPINFDVTTGKTNFKKILNMIKKLGGMRLDCALQSLNPKTLAYVKRKNLTLDQYSELQKEVKKENIVAVAELICPMPFETKDTFLDGLKRCVNSGIDYVYSYTTMMLHGTELASDYSRETYEMKTKYRILPRTFGTYNGEKCYEIEEVCISTNTFSFEDYIECRGIVLISYLLGSDQVDIISLLLRKLGITNFDFIYKVWKDIEKDTTILNSIYNDYFQETKEELWDSKEEIYQYFSILENYDLLLKGQLGDNLIRKYKTKLLIENYEKIMSLFYKVIENLGKDKIDEDMKVFLGDSKKWAIANRDIGDLLKEKITDTVKILDLSYDINKWYISKRIEDDIISYKSNSTYKVYYKDVKKIQESVNQRKKLFGEDNSYNIGKILIDGSISFLWKDCEKMSI